MEDKHPASQDVNTTMWFLKEKVLYTTVKPYCLAFTPETDVPRDNIERHEVPVGVLDIRGRREPLNFHHNGFAILNVPEVPTGMDWYDVQSVKGLRYPQIVSEIERVVWHPIKGPNQDWPLALCDLSTVNSDKDLEIADYVTPKRSREHCMVYFRNHHRWWYMSRQRVTEALLFRQHDSEQGDKSGVPHAAFFNPYAELEMPRESMETTVLIYF
ncbi:methyltransferase [Grosmannia clavigera kw1407]|uniref:Methyltransferase n=1 Tax=Grosmannia clavigera (strain kw1407 / UAMH 11150) TaxID=655863 RepID=F0XPP5_GROCL|nr:methyltransferase [Grosmannia clavigera kw1407]EFX00240.1 methyltransferase [Grosmannia clavigera kw1407]